ncbi:hypothetical protein DFH09DRAFT_1089938 [Mycena vulgaris]|nr:hypothetical protein DFH09DRAFT_1089938 [Mycena vulgaris]
MNASRDIHNVKSPNTTRYRARSPASGRDFRLGIRVLSELPRSSRPVAKASDITDYFDPGTPKVVDADHIRALFAPKDDVVERLYEHMTTSHTCMPDTTPVRCLHLPNVETIGLMPLWIITYDVRWESDEDFS